MSSNPTRITMKKLLNRGAKGNHLMKRLRALSLVSAKLTIEFAMQYTYSYTLPVHILTLKPISDENSEHGLWVLLCL